MSGVEAEEWVVWRWRSGWWPPHCGLPESSFLRPLVLVWCEAGGAMIVSLTLVPAIIAGIDITASAAGLQRCM